MTTYRRIDVDGVKVFVREAGDRSAPAIVLLHGYPSSSHMFRDLIPLLADRFRVIAPDMVGFGHSDAPAIDRFDYTFDRLAEVTDRVLRQLEVGRSILYMQDYGGASGPPAGPGAPPRGRRPGVPNGKGLIEGVRRNAAPPFSAPL